MSEKIEGKTGENQSLCGRLADDIGVSENLVKMMGRFVFPRDLGQAAEENQVAGRVRGLVGLLGKGDATSVIDYGKSLYGGYDTGCNDTDGYDRLFLVLKSISLGEGDLTLAILGYPREKEDGLARLAQISFIVEPEAITITGLQGSVSSSTPDASRRFGREFLDGADLYGRLQKTFSGMKPFGCLIGLLVEIARARGIKVIRGVERNKIPSPHVFKAKHDFSGAYYGVGLRPAGREGVFEAKIDSEESIRKCFSRVTGKDAKIRKGREEAFGKSLETLKNIMPVCFGPSVPAIRGDTKNRTDECLEKKEEDKQ